MEHPAQQGMAADAERERLLAKAKRIWVEILVLLFCTLWGPVLLVRALRLRKQLRQRGIDPPTETSIAIGCGGFMTLYLVAAFAAGGIALVFMAFADPEVYVANGWDRPVDVRIDGAMRGSVEGETPLRLELEAGLHELCAVQDGEVLACASRELEHRDRLLWNPAGRARFVGVTTTYTSDRSIVEDDRVEYLPRSEWHDLHGYYYLFRDPPDEIYIERTTETRRWIKQAASDSSMLVVDNGTDVTVEVLIDGVLAATIEPRHYQAVRTTEGSRAIVIRGGGVTYFDRSHPVADYGSYVVDLEGRTPYVIQVKDETGRVLSERPVAAMQIHDVSRFESVFDSLTAWSSWQPEPRGERRVFTWAPAESVR